MALEFRTSRERAGVAVGDLLAVPVFAEGRLGPGADAVDGALDGGLAAFMDEAGFDGKVGQTLAVPTQGRLGARAAVLVGLGDPDDLDLEAVRRAAAAVAKRARKVATLVTTLLDAVPKSVDRRAAAQAIAEGAALGSYQFLRYKGEAATKATKLRTVVVLGAGGAPVAKGLERGARIAEAVMWARDLVNEPSGTKSPTDVVAAARDLFKGTGVRVTVWSGAKLAEERLGGVIGVGKGSDREPHFLKLVYAPKGATSTVALVGKGVVFDSGGLSIKPAEGMETMKTDMSGAAAVIASMSTLADLGVKCRVIGYVPLVENMPSGTTYRPGDVLRMRNDKTVEVLNTDAEGRLILADALSLAAEDAPDAVIDLATLTGACMVALGDKYAGLMGVGDGWVEQVREAGERAGEPLWRLPLPKQYRKQLDSEVADLKNIGNRYGGALTAGLFLQEFAGDVAWVHLDIAGPARASADDGYLIRGGTGFGTRTLIELVSSFRKPRAAKSR